MSADLFKKLVKVLAEIERIPKSGRNKFHGYDYVTEGDLVDHIRPKLAAAGVFLFTSIESVSAAEVVERKNSEGRIVNVATIHTFVCAETGAEFSVKGAGCGEDSGDKALYKAITGAEKYMLMKNFLVATGDDPEVDSPAVKTPVKSAPTPAPEPEKPDIRVIGLAEVKKQERDGTPYMMYQVTEGTKKYEASCWEPIVWGVLTSAMESGMRCKVTVKTNPEGKVKIVKAEAENAPYEVKPAVNRKNSATLKGAEEKMAELISGGK